MPATSYVNLFKQSSHECDDSLGKKKNKDSINYVRMKLDYAQRVDMAVNLQIITIIVLLIVPSFIQSNPDGRWLSNYGETVIVNRLNYSDPFLKHSPKTMDGVIYFLFLVYIFVGSTPINLLIFNRIIRYRNCLILSYIKS